LQHTAQKHAHTFKTESSKSEFPQKHYLRLRQISVQVENHNTYLSHKIVILKENFKNVSKSTVGVRSTWNITQFSFAVSAHATLFHPPTTTNTNTGYWLVTGHSINH